MKSLIRAVIVCGVLVGAVWFASHVLRILLTEDRYCQRPSLAYYVAIHSRLIKQAPLLQMKSGPVFYASCGDGPKPQANGITCLSRAPATDLERELTRYILEAGYERGHDKDGTLGRVFRRGQDQVELSISPADGFSRVSIRAYTTESNATDPPMLSSYWLLQASSVGLPRQPEMHCASFSV